nr:MAG TPA: hypothetical protein [Caudoviricetes sp.]
MERKRKGFDREYATSFRREVAFLAECGIRYTFVKRVQEVSVYKYEKTPELFAKLAEFYAQKISD